MRHLSLEITPKPKKGQAANGSRLPVSRWFPAGTIKHGGFRVHEGQTGAGRARLLQREARLSDPGNFFLRKNDAWVRVHPRMSFFFFFFSLQMVLGTLHSKSTKNMELFKKSWDISSRLTK